MAVLITLIHRELQAPAAEEAEVPQDIVVEEHLLVVRVPQDKDIMVVRAGDNIIPAEEEAQEDRVQIQLHGQTEV